MSIFLIILALVLIGQGVFHTSRSIRFLFKWAGSKKWLQITGEIVQSEVSSFSFIQQERKQGKIAMRFVPEIEYENKVSLVPYRSKQLYWVQNLVRNTFEDAERVKSQYSVGMIIKVYFNPDNPKEAVLDTEKSRNVIGEFFASLLPMCIGFFVLYYAISHFSG